MSKKSKNDIKRLYGTSLFSDLKVSLNPVPGSSGSIKILLGVTEQRTGTLTGGIGYSGSQGVFGQGGLQESNFLGRSWKTKFNKAKLLKTNDEDREEDDGDNINNNTNELEQETFDMDGNTYNINDFEKARQDAIANRQKKQ